MLVRLVSLRFPALQGPFLVDGLGRPRYWAAVWVSFLPADLSASTLAKKLGHIEIFYQHSDETLGAGRLDDALADFDLESLSSALEGYFLRIRNQLPISSASEERWQSALQFVIETVRRLTRSNPKLDRISDLRARLIQLELLHARLHIGKRRRPERIRSPPSDVD